MNAKLKKLCCVFLALLMVLSTTMLPSVAAGEEVAEDTTTTTATPEAKIGDTEYAILAEAVKAVEKGTTATATTITLLKDVEVNNQMIGHQHAQNIILDLGGYTLSSKNIALTAYRAGTTLVVQNGTVKGNSTSGTLRATYGGKLVLGENLTVEAGNVASAVYVSSGEVEVTSDTVNIASGQNSIVVTENASNKVTISGGNFSAPVVIPEEVDEVAISGGSFTDTDINPEWVKGEDVAYDSETGTVGTAYNFKVGDTTCEKLAEALDAAIESGKTLVLARSIELSEMVVIPEGAEVTLDLNGKVITGTDNATKNFALIEIKPGAELTITGNGKITLTATNNRGWSNYSSVISNQRGKLTVENGTIEHLGSTDMAYGIDNLTNGKGTYAETIINGGTIKSTYRGIRQFLNGVEAQNILTINGGTIEGANRSVWMQEANAKANNGKLTISEKATLKGNVYLFVTAGATEWPVEVSIAAAAFAEGYDVVTGNVPAQYVLDNVGGTYQVVKNPAYGMAAKAGDTYFDTLAAAIEAAVDGETVTLLSDVALTDADFGEKHDGYNTFFNISGKSITVDFNGKTITADVSAATPDAFILGVFVVTDGGHLTLKDSAEVDGGIKGVSGSTQEQAYLDPAKGNWDYNYKFYSLLVNYDNDCSIVIEGGNYDLDFAGDSLIYSSNSTEEGAKKGELGVWVQDGSFKVGNLGGIRNGMPWVFNARGQNGRDVYVTGGTFCSDIQHQYYTFEVYVPRYLALQQGEDGMYTIVDAVAYVTEPVWCCSWYYNEVGYATLEAAIAACNGPQNVTYYKKVYTSEPGKVVLLSDVTLAENTTIVIGTGKSVIIDLNGKTIYGENTRTNTHNFLIDVKGGTLTAYNGTIAMKHTGANMGWNGATTVIDVTAGGVLNLNFVVVENQGGTDMNFAVHMNNWGEVTLNADNCEFNSTYCGVRVFNSGYDMNNVKITNSKLTGKNRAFWVHNYLGDLDSSKHSDEAIKARLNLDIYDNNNTFEITDTAKSPIRYGFSNTVYFDANGSQIVDSAEELQDAINNGSGNISLGGDIDLSEGLVFP